MLAVWNAILPLIGVLIGSFTTYKVQKNLYDHQLKVEKEKELYKQQVEILKMYSEILQVDSENEVLVHEVGGTAKFNLEVYKKNVRPLFYKYMYLLDRRLTFLVKDFDQKLIDIRYGGFESEELIDAHGKADYENIIRIVQENLKMYKKKVERTGEADIDDEEPIII